MATDDNNSARSFAQEFCADLRRWSRSQPDKLLFLALLLAWVALFHFWGNSTFGFKKTPSLFGWMQYVFDTSVDDQFCLYVPLLVLALFYWKREELIAVPKRNWWPALFLVALGLIIHVLGFMVQQTRVSIVGFFVGLYGLTGLLWGAQWLKTSFFPMCLFVFCVPLGTMADSLTLPLRILVTKLSVAIGHEGLGITVSAVGSQVINAQGIPLYDVAPACSGIRSLTALLALTIIYGFLFFERPWKRLLIILASVPMAIAGNVARLTVVIAVGEVFGRDAGKMVEQKFGFVTFVVAIVFMLVLGHWLREGPVENVGSLEKAPA
jgi:exosortase